MLLLCRETKGDGERVLGDVDADGKWWASTHGKEGEERYFVCASHMGYSGWQPYPLIVARQSGGRRRDVCMLSGSRPLTCWSLLLRPRYAQGSSLKELRPLYDIVSLLYYPVPHVR